MREKKEKEKSRVKRKWERGEIFLEKADRGGVFILAMAVSFRFSSTLLVRNATEVQTNGSETNCQIVPETAEREAPDNAAAGWTMGS